MMFNGCDNWHSIKETCLQEIKMINAANMILESIILKLICKI